MYKHYIEIDDFNSVTKSFCDFFEEPTEDSILIRESVTDRSFNLHIYDLQGRYNYLYDGELESLIREQTEEEKEASYLNSKPLAEWKRLKKLEIDRKTQEIVARGFVYDDITFSLSLPAQSNFTNLYNQRNTVSYPVELSNIDNTDFRSMANATEVAELYEEAFAVVIDAFTGGTARKQVVEALATAAEVVAYEDDRE